MRIKIKKVNGYNRNVTLFHASLAGEYWFFNIVDIEEVCKCPKYRVLFYHLVDHVGIPSYKKIVDEETLKKYVTKKKFKEIQEYFKDKIRMYAV